MKLKVKTQDEMIRAEAKLLRRMVRRSRRTRLRSSVRSEHLLGVQKVVGASPTVGFKTAPAFV